MKSAFLLALSLISPYAHTNRDIVYAARYYHAPGSHGTSHFHLYRINPNGTGRTQLTYGDYDDSNPEWSPNGHWIAFLRGLGSLCVVSAHGREVKTLINDPDGDYQVKDHFAAYGSFCWLPDSRHLLILKGQDNPGAYMLSIKSPETDKSFTTFEDIIYNDATDYVVAPNHRHAYLDRSGHGVALMDTWKAGKLVTMNPAPTVFFPTWLNSQTLIGLISRKYFPLQFAVMGLSGNIENNGALGFTPSAENKMNFVSLGLSYMQGIPGQLRQFLFASDNSDSTIRPQLKFYTMNLYLHTVKLFLENVQFVVFKPRSLKCCVAPSKNLWHDGDDLDVNGHLRTIWAAPLMIGRYPSKKLKSITPGLVWVTGADWR